MLIVFPPWHLLICFIHSNIFRIIYLTLVNYADLLNCACTCGLHRCSTNLTSILSKSVVSPLQHFSREPATNEPCLWGENEEVTKKLVLVSYCEAADLDGSDPMIWLKIASAARCLSVVQSSSSISMDNVMIATDRTFPKFARLERYAIERGLMSLPSHVPSNRCLSLAYREHCHFVESSEADKRFDADTLDNVLLEVNLSNYSWAALGRLLVRVCKDGGGLGYREKVHKADKSKHMHLLGSPALKLHVSLILAMPQNILGEICEYLSAKDEHSLDLKNLECTCRSLSSAVVSARAYSQQKKLYRLRRMETALMTQLSEDANQAEEIKNIVSADVADGAPQNPHRLSKRLRSQIMSTGKQNERSTKRGCVHNALAVIASSYSADHPKYLSVVEESKSIDWRSWCPFATEVERICHSKVVVPIVTSSKKAISCDFQYTADTALNSGSTCLLDFLHAVNQHNSGPYNVLRHFLSFIALNVNKVYQPMDEGGRIVLSACLLDCTYYVSSYRWIIPLIRRYFNLTF